MNDNFGFQSGGGGGTDPALALRVTTLEDNELKITYYEVISGTSGSLTIPTNATINEGEFGLSGNAVLSKIDGSNKPTYESPKTAGGVVVTASLNATTGAWIASGVYTDANVALIYSIKIKTVYQSALNYNRIIDTVELTDFPISQTITSGVTDKAPSEDAVFDALNLKADNLIAKQNTTISHTGTTAETIIWSKEIIAGTIKSNDFLRILAFINGTNSASNKTIKLYINDTLTLAGATQIGVFAFTSSFQGNIPFCRNLIFQNSLSSQRIIGSAANIVSDEANVGGFNTPDSTYTLNFATGKYIILSFTLANSSETMNLRMVKLKIDR